MNMPTQLSDVAAKLSPKKKSRIRIIMIGSVVLLLGLFLAFLWIGHQITEAMKSWGKPEISILGTAKAKIVESTPLRPSDKASVFYFFVDGFQSPTILASYTEDPKTIGNAVKTITGKSLDELEPVKLNKNYGSYQIEDKSSSAEINIYDPSFFEKDDKTPFYDLDTISEGKFYHFVDEKSHADWTLIVDTKTNRLYFLEME